MSTVVPAISTNFLKNLLKKYDDVTNLKFSITPIEAGENYTSNLYQLTITYEASGKCNKERSYILKCLSEDEVLSDYAKLTNIFVNEVDMYNRVLPNIYSLERVKQFSPVVLYASLTPQTILILEDLTKRGYKMQCRHEGLDLNHCMLVVEKLAYLHASSIAETLVNFNLGIFWENQYSTRWVTIGFENLIQTCSKFNDLKLYASKLHSLQDHFLEKAYASPKSTTVCNVLNHGDCWINNLMFSYNEDGTVKEVVLLDFQQCIYSSPVIDLHFFWATSPNMDVLIKHFGKILDYYCNEFFNNLQKLKIVENVPNKLEIESEFKQKAIYGLMTLLTTTSFIKSTKRPDASIENFLKFSGEGSYRHDCFNNERYIERIAHLLPFYDSLGVFE